jgi:hypothetical protein
MAMEAIVSCFQAILRYFPSGQNKLRITETMDEVLNQILQNMKQKARNSTANFLL